MNLESFVNTRIMSNPLNWVTIPVMIYLGALALDLLTKETN